MPTKDLNKIVRKYNLSTGNKELLCFTAVIETLINKVKKKELKLFKEFKKKESFVIVDIGSGYFRYGKALYAVFSKINPNIKLVAVDKEKFFKSSYYSPAAFIKGDITKIELEKYGIEKIDIVTVFNPFPGIPDLTNIPKASLLIGCVDWNKKLFENSLKKNGFQAIVWQENFFWQEMRAWWNNYNPFVAAKTIHYKESLSKTKLDKLKGRDELCRIFYIDSMLYKYTNSSEFNENFLKERLEEIKNDSKKLPIEEIKKRIIDINSGNKKWYERFEQQDFIKKKIDVNDLVIEPWHNGLDGVLDCTGKSIPKFLEENKNNNETKNRKNFVLKHFDLIIKYLPIIVKQNNNGKFDVMSGNHRIMASIEKDYSEIECLVIL